MTEFTPQSSISTRDIVMQTTQCGHGCIESSSRSIDDKALLSWWRLRSALSEKTCCNAILETRIDDHVVNAFAHRRRAIGLRPADLRTSERITIVVLHHAEPHHGFDVGKVTVLHGLFCKRLRLLDHKLRQLRIEFIRCFNHLARKPGLVSDIRIDAVTFTTMLLDGRESEVPKSALSAGEKQVYAIAMLWALARTSGRPLPMIIDTPLARLDSEHRSNLIERYFPAASHQVIMLSTDTEIDAGLAEKLKPSISHAFRLDFDPGTDRTSVSSGYFQDTTTIEDEHALQQA